MYIGFDAKRAFNNRSGLGNYSRNLLTALFKYYPENQYFLYSPKVNRTIFDVAAKNFFIREPVRPVHKLFSSFWRSFALSGELKKDDLDIYHGLSHELPAGISAGIKTVVTIHDLIFLRHPELYKKIDRLIYRKKFESACRSASRIVAISHQTAEDIVQFFNINREKTEVVYQSCSPAFFDKPDKNTQTIIRQKYRIPESYVLYVGTIEERKNLLGLIKAMHIGQIDVPLVVVGRKTGYFRKAADYIKLHGLRDIYFFDVIHNEDLPFIYQMASVFVYPSLFEGFGIPVLEALASGTPVITSKGGCFKEAGGPGTKYINPFDETEIAGALKTVLSDTGLRNNMIQTGYNHAGNFTPDKTAGNMMKVYKKVLQDEV